MRSRALCGVRTGVGNGIGYGITIRIACQLEHGPADFIFS
jgi:hypothetical protein